MTDPRLEIRVTGFGGQGIILTGLIIGKAVALYHGRHAALVQNYGPEARGSACRADLILAGEPIDYPAVLTPNVLIVLSQDGYATHKGRLRPDGLLLLDEDLVRPDKESPILHAAIPATRLAVETGHKIMANIVMLGFLTALTDLVGHDQMRQAVASSVPPGTDEKNLSAFDTGHQYGTRWMQTHLGGGNGRNTHPLLRK